jgi:hypothetical protein
MNKMGMGLLGNVNAEKHLTVVYEAWVFRAVRVCDTLVNMEVR